MRVALFGIILAAFAVRLIGLNWDDGQLLHPDEYHVTEVTVDRVQLPLPPDWSNLADPAVSTLNPRSDGSDGNHRSFAYGSLPLYATDLVAEGLNRAASLPVLSTVIAGPPGQDWHSLDQLFKVGRLINMMLDTMGVAMVFAIARMVGGRAAGIGAAAIYAFAPVVIQLAHFYTTDSWLTFGAALTLLCAIRAARNGDRRLFLVAGLAAGFTLATKPTGVATFALVGLAILYDAWLRHRSGHTATAVFGAIAERFVLAAIATIVVFVIAEPYAVLDPTSYLADLREQTSIQRGTFDVPYTRVYIGTTPMVYQFEQLVRFGMGPVGGLLGVFGIVALAWRAWRHRGAAELMTLGWILIFLATLLLPQTKFLRYIAPMVPALAVAGGYLLSRIVRLRLPRFGRAFGLTAAAAAMAGLVFWVAVTSSVYASDNTRISASRWIYDNVPPGSAITTEVWDRGVPLDLGPVLSAETFQYEWLSLDSYTDRPVYGDLVAIAEVLNTVPAVQPAAPAIRANDFATAEATLVASAPDLAAMDEASRYDLASRLVEVEDSFSDSSYNLRYATDVVIDALNDPTANDLEGAWSALGVEISLAGSEEAAAAIYSQLDQADYYVISSNRITASLPQLPWRYPVQIAFFAALESGQLGYTQVADFRSHPEFAGISIDDDAADETWINYDHPRVQIFQKTNLIPPDQFNELLASPRLQPVSPTRTPPANDLMLDQPNGELPVVSDARWSSSITDNSGVALAVWVLLLVVLQVAGLPLAQLLLGNLAEGGWVFSRMLITLAAAFVVWMGASTGLFLFRAVWCAAALIVIAGLFWFLRARWGSGRRFFAVSADQRRVAGIGEIVFWSVFVFFVVLRFYNPDSWEAQWGGEKPMEFAHLNATLRSSEFPPYDPWFSGGYLNYYYYGLYVVAFLIKLTGIPAEIAFNLAQPTVMAFLGSAAYGVAATLGRDLSARLNVGRLATIAGGLMGAVLMVGVGNLGGFFNLFDRQIGGWAVVWNPSRALGNDSITEFPYFTGLYADLHAHGIALPITVLVIALCYSLASQPRLLTLALSSGRVGRWRALLGARVVALSIALGTLYMTNAWDIATYVLFAAASVFIATRSLPTLVARLVAAVAGSLVIAVLGFASVLPFYLKFVTLFSSLGGVEEPTNFWNEMLHFGGLIAIVIVGMTALLCVGARGGWRVWLQPLLPILGISFVLVFAAILNRPTVSDESGLQVGDLVILALIAILTLILSAAAWSRGNALGGGAPLPMARRLVIVVAAVVTVGAAVVGQPVFGLGAVIVGVGAFSYLFLPGTAPRMIGLMIAAGGGVVAALEVIYLVDNLAGGSAYRMNTVFKFYNQTWVLLALSGAGLFAWMLARLVAPVASRRPAVATASSGAPSGVQVVAPQTPSGPITNDPVPVMATVSPPGLPSVAWSKVGLVVVALVVGASACYPLTATSIRLDNRFAGTPNTLNAYEWMDHANVSSSGPSCTDVPTSRTGMSFSDDRAAIDWFNSEVNGSPVIAELSLEYAYWCLPSRFSVSTGLPTILGWRNHESQQRYSDDLGPRLSDVETLYNSTDLKAKLDILREYGVEYIVVGTLERQLTDEGRPVVDPAGLVAFEGMVGTSLEVAFEQGETTVYRVLPASAIPPGP